MQIGGGKGHNVAIAYLKASSVTSSLRYNGTNGRDIVLKGLGLYPKGAYALREPALTTCDAWTACLFW